MQLRSNGAHGIGHSINDMNGNVLSGRDTIGEMGDVLIQESVIKRLNDQIAHETLKRC
jgi:hypothetical protein